MSVTSKMPKPKPAPAYSANHSTHPEVKHLTTWNLHYYLHISYKIIM